MTMTRRALVDQVGEVERVRERVRAQDREDDDQHDETEDGRQRPDVAAADAVPRSRGPASADALGLSGQRGLLAARAQSRWGRSCRPLLGLVADDRDAPGVAGGIAGAIPMSPDLPAVMSSTTCWLVTDAGVDLGDHLAQVEDRDVVGDAETSLRLWLIRTTAEAAVGEPADQVEDLLGLGHAERGGRLVQDDQLGVPQHGPGDGHGLPLATGQAGDDAGAPTSPSARTGRRGSRPRAAPSSPRPAPRGWSARGRGTCCGRCRGCRTARGPGTRPRSPARWPGLGLVHRHRLALERVRAGVEGVDARRCP